MDRGEIPGYFFDAEKGKYFKYHPNPAHANSKENVAKRLKKEKAESSAAAQKAEEKAQRIVVPHKKNLHHQILRRELADNSKPFFSRSVWPAASAAGFNQTKALVKGHSLIRLFDYDTKSGTVFAVCGETRINKYTSRGPGRPNTRTELLVTTSTVSSLNYLPASDTLAATTYGSDRPPVVYLTNPGTDLQGVGQVFTPANCPVIWSSAPRPTFSTSREHTSSVHAADTEFVAFGASKDMKLLQSGPDGNWIYNDALKTESDVLALSWLSPTILSLGGRDGHIRIYDIRAKGSTKILTHSTPISQIRPADDFQRIVVSGIRDTLMVYDMRMGLTSDVPEDRSKRQKYHKRPKPKTSAFYTQFNSHANHIELDLGMDVNPRLGLVAAGDGDRNLNIHNLYTGELLKQWSNASAESAHGRSIRSVRFVIDHNGDEALMATVDGVVVTFSWSGSG